MRIIVQHAKHWIYCSLSLKIFVVDEHTDELKKSIEDVEAGKTYKAKDAKDLMRKIYG